MDIKIIREESAKNKLPKGLLKFTKIMLIVKNNIPKINASTFKFFIFFL
ncbi:MAG: hypothetical protein QXQ14_03740 [Candidatus Aenigmatarchaeota archaeon]